MEHQPERRAEVLSDDQDSVTAEPFAIEVGTALDPAGSVKVTTLLLTAVTVIVALG